MRSTTRDVSNRAQNGHARGTVTKADDTKKMQELSVEILKGELKTGIERFQNYGHTSVPLPETGGNSPEAAEFVVAFIGGNRSHPVVIAVDDRRYRKNGLQPGESALYDDQGQFVHITRGGIKIDGGAKNLPLTISIGGSVVTIADGTITLKSDKIVLDGTVYLGGADADKPASMQGTTDTNGDSDVGNLATKVFVK